MGALSQKRSLSLTCFVFASQNVHSGKFKHLIFSENDKFSGTNSVDSILGRLERFANFSFKNDSIYLITNQVFPFCFQVRHCALSLVGEPIMYPEINKYVDLLHSKEISSFMVCNAQFPDAMRQLKPVTQLYVSIDASTKDTLKAIDRPLHKDFWER